MKRIQQSVLLASMLALSLAACSTPSWKSGSSGASGNGSSTDSGVSIDSGPNSGSATGGASGANEKSSVPSSGPNGQRP